MNLNRPLFAMVLLLAFAGGLYGGNAQKAATSKYFYSAGGGFGGDLGKPELFYGVILDVRKRIPDGAVADFIFENPADKNAPFLVTVVVKGDPKSIRAESQPLPSIENDRVYTYKVLLYRDASRKEKLGEHSQKLGFSVPAEVFETVFKKGVFKQS